MGTVKGDLLKEIEKKAAARKELQQEIADRHKNIETYLLQMVTELDEAASSSAGQTFVHFCVGSIESRIHALDPGAKIDVSWQPTAELKLNGILIKWSPEYQKQNDCEAELYVDIYNLLFK